MAVRVLNPVLVTAAASVLGFATVGDGFGAHAAHAAPLGVIEGESLDVSADHFDIDVERGTATLQGNVVARVGELEVRCPVVELSYDDSPRVKWARAKGGVTARFKGIDATSGVAELDAKSRAVTLSGGVRLSRGRGWITAQQATVDIATGKVSLQEVKGVIPVGARIDK